MSKIVILLGSVLTLGMSFSSVSAHELIAHNRSPDGTTEFYVYSSGLVPPIPPKTRAAEDYIVVLTTSQAKIYENASLYLNEENDTYSIYFKIDGKDYLVQGPRDSARSAEMIRLPENYRPGTISNSDD